MENRGKLKAMFIIPSAIGVILFMIPVKNAAGEWTVTVKIIADIIAGAIGGFLPILSVAIVTISGCDDARGAGKAQVHHGKPRT